MIRSRRRKRQQGMFPGASEREPALAINICVERPRVLTLALLIIIALCVTSCQDQDNRSPWVLVFRDTQDFETSLDVSRIEFFKEEVLFWTSTKMDRGSGKYRYKREVVRFSQGQMKTLESLNIYGNGKIEVLKTEDVWREIGSTGVDRVLYDLLCPGGEPAALEYIREKAWSIETVLLRLTS